MLDKYLLFETKVKYIKYETNVHILIYNLVFILILMIDILHIHELFQFFIILQFIEELQVDMIGHCLLNFALRLKFDQLGSIFVVNLRISVPLKNLLNFE